MAQKKNCKFMLVLFLSIIYTQPAKRKNCLAERFSGGKLELQRIPATYRKSYAEVIHTAEKEHGRGNFELLTIKKIDELAGIKLYNMEFVQAVIGLKTRP